MNRTFYFILLLMVLTIHYSYGQYADNKELPSVMPASPTAFEFLKYGEVPISKYTGIPNVSIPIYTIKAKGLDIPIHLTYHSNGFRVNEEAGWTGLGWSLNAEGSIVQVVNGYDDYGTYKNRTFIDVDSIASVASDGNSPSGVLSTCSGTIIGLNQSNFLNLPDNDGSCLDSDTYTSSELGHLVYGTQDFEPDIFKFNMLGYSGEFVLDWENEQFVCLTDNKIRITNPNYVEGQITTPHQFMIDVPEGHKFIFERKDETVFTFKYPFAPNTPLAEEKSSRTYKLVRIYTNKNDIIDFTYEMAQKSHNIPGITMTSTKYESLPGAWAFPPSLINPTIGDQYSVSNFSTEQSISYLSTITFNNGFIGFNTSDRTDLVGSKKLDQIEVRKNSSSGPVIKLFDFDYDYFEGHSNGTKLTNILYFDGVGLNQKTPQELTHRLKLNSITESGKNPYLFEYNPVVLPSKISLATDYWGYYSGYLNNQTLFPNIYRFNIEIGNNDYASHNANNKSPNEIFTKAAVLEKITYPTKGYTTFEYELNSFDNVFIPHHTVSNTSDSESFGAGLRTKTINSYDYTGIKTQSKHYIYRGGRLNTPIAFFNYAFIATYTGYQSAFPYVNEGVVYNGRGYRKTFSSSNFISPSINGNGQNVGYDEVDEIFASTTDELNTSGKITDVYYNEPNQGGFGNPMEKFQSFNGVLRELRMPLREHNGASNGLLKEQYTYDKDNILLLKTENGYTSDRIYCTNGATIGSPYYNSMCDPHTPSPIFNHTRMLGVYPISRLNSYLSTATKTEYFEGNEIVTTQHNSYNQLNQLTNVLAENSNGDTRESKYYYPLDILSSTGNYTMNILFNYLLKKETFINGDLTEIEKFNYVAGNNSPLPVTYKLSSYEYGKFSEDNLEEIVSYHRYDELGNPLEVSKKDGTRVCYIWGYNKMYPIAKIENANYSDLPENVLELFQNYPGSVIYQSAFRTHPDLSKAMISTYTYDPLIGVTSMTDPRGYTIYYEYDAFNRLKWVKDADGNILSENKYNYATQN